MGVSIFAVKYPIFLTKLMPHLISDSILPVQKNSLKETQTTANGTGARSRQTALETITTNWKM